MDLDQSPNLTPLFYKWDGEPLGPAQVCLSLFVVQLFPSVNGTFHPRAGQFHFAVFLSAPDGDCDILLLPVYCAPFLLFVSLSLPGISVHRSCVLLKQSCLQLL